MGKRKHSKFHDTALLNMKTFDFYNRRFFELATTSIEWTGLPPEIDYRYLEMLLYNNGQCIFFYDAELGQYIVAQCAAGGNQSVYGIPNDREAFAPNNTSWMLSYENSVIIYNNFIRSPTALDMELYAYRLYELERSVDVNIKGQKTPKIVMCDENQRLTMENLFMQYEGNTPFIMANKNLDLHQIQAVDISSPFVTDKLQIAKRQIFNEALTLLGIENNSNEKAERLVTNESITNSGAVVASRNARLAARKQACEQINRMYSLQIDVEFKQPMSYEIELETEETENGELYN